MSPLPYLYSQFHSFKSSSSLALLCQHAHHQFYTRFSLLFLHSALKMQLNHSQLRISHNFPVINVRSLRELKLSLQKYTLISCYDFLFLLFDHFALRTNTSALKRPSPDTLRLRVLRFSLFFPTFPSKIKAFPLIENPHSFIIKSTPHHTPTPHTCVPPVLHYLLLTENSENIVLKAMMNFVCREVTCVSYRHCYLLIIPTSLLNYCNIFHNISSESIILRRTYTLLPNFNMFLSKRW